MFVKPKTNPTYAPASGCESLEPSRVLFRVFDPALKNFIPAEGREIGTDNDLYWHRRAAAGEVEVLSAEDGAKSIAEAERARIAAAAAEAKEKAAAEKSAAAPAETSKGAK